MPRPKNYTSRADKQRAYRQRQKQAGLPEEPHVDEGRPEGLREEARAEVPRSPGPQAVQGELTQEAYVAAETAVTAWFIDNTDLKDPEGQRLLRAEAYARWRWEGFHEGTVASL